MCNFAGLEDLHIDDRADIGATSTSGDDYENVDREPMRPRESAAVDREPLRESQMTVPETPSPDMLAAGKGGRRRDFLAGRNADNPSPTKGRGKPQRNATAANVQQNPARSHMSCGPFQPEVSFPSATIYQAGKPDFH